MSKGLEALENICNQCEHYQFEKGLRPKKCPFNKSCVFKQRIEKELKRLEEIDNILNTGGGIWAENGIVAKKLKALEIIKREPSMVGWQAGYEDYEDYLDNTPEEQRFIKNKEEYDLLKEVLL